MSVSRAFVSLIGAGPGDPGLLTLNGQRALEQADVVLFDYLANSELLRHCPNAETVYVGKKGFSEHIEQEQINALLVHKALANGGQRVARLKGGDVFVYGRGGEEAEACVANGVPFEIVPGVTSAIAAPAYAGIPVTHRKVARSFAVLTGHTKEGAAYYQRLSGVDTLVLLMSLRTLEQMANDLMASGRPPGTPAATIQWGSLPEQRVVTATLGTIAGAVREAGIGAPAVTVVGEVVRLRETLNWFGSQSLAQPQPRPLAGKTVAVTRTRGGNSELAALLRERGAGVLEVPLIRFAPTSNLAPLHARLRDLSGVNWLLLTSNQGVAALFEQLGALGLDARHLAEVKVAAVGPSTARSLAEHGIRADFVPSAAGAKHLGAQLPLNPGEAALHLTSQLAEDALQVTLEARGLRYERAEVYRTEPAPLPDAERQRLLHADAVTLASGSAARHLARLTGPDLNVVAMGPQTADAARAAGFTRVTVARTAQLEALAEAVVQAVTAGGDHTAN
ncbi:uroporphyrinogen-III C-methyltransferase [Deinococcus sp.]|uniref:uroporphyrinogen-III C-methyltransferase n=1 Tax=Deinococcus sp. TaxID=47478 RepID=UPI0025BC8A52|nr:uroporphyrinogen-III C-methyltransferase [Deinococcus sp.]